VPGDLIYESTPEIPIPRNAIIMVITYEIIIDLKTIKIDSLPYTIVIETTNIPVNIICTVFDIALLK